MTQLEQTLQELSANNEALEKKVKYLESEVERLQDENGQQLQTLRARRTHNANLDDQISSLTSELEESKAVELAIWTKYGMLQIAAFNLFTLRKVPNLAAQIENNEVLKMIFQNIYCEIAGNREDLEANLRSIIDKDSADKMLNDTARVLDYYQKVAKEIKHEPRFFERSVNNQNMKPLKS
jgi:hypothetical protein